MYYSLLVPPTSRPRRELTRKEAREYFEWFVDQIPRRIEILERAVKTSVDNQFESWSANKTPASLDVLGPWFARHVEKEPVSEEFKEDWSLELEKIEAKYRPIFDVPQWTLTNRTYSLIHDVGMYLGEVFREHSPILEWQLDTKYKRSVDYQEPVLAAPGMDYGINPVRLVHVIALGFTDGTKPPSALHKVFDTWIVDLARDQDE
jgi:hypothetical protein